MTDSMEKEHRRKISTSDGLQLKKARESVKKLKNELKSELFTEFWKIILTKYSYKFGENLDFLNVFKFCLKRDIITKDLKTLKSNLQIIRKFDLIEKLSEYESTFSEITDAQFSEFFKDVAIIDERQSKWKAELQRHIHLKNSKVQVILGSSQTVHLESIFTPLTIIEQEFYKKVLGHENTEYEVELLMNYGGKSECTSVEFQSSRDIESEIPNENRSLINLFAKNKLIEVMCCHEKKEKTNKPQESLLCIIGNPGSGKTFLSSRIALLYSHNQLDQFKYCLDIPCRNPEWHLLEILRENRGGNIPNDFIKGWLKLGMKQNIKWSEELAEDIVNSDGEDLLLIIDSIDEFTKEIPFNQTLLSSLLRRKCLTKSTILLTSRPGVWSDITSQHKDIAIDSQFHVLGFSPGNRDQFFNRALNDESKYTACQKLFRHHHEISLLSLIPVNASFFAELFKSTGSITSLTLTQLFSSLVLYLIRRQLSRMSLGGYIEVESIAELDGKILQCLYGIGEVAYQGIPWRELSFTHNFSLNIKGEKKKNSEWLGLANVHIKEKTPGVRIKVWSFSHLTMQEFVSALWLSNTKWFTICLVSRYVVSTMEVFSLFKMVLRFVCGLLGEEALNPINIVFKYQLIPPIEFRNQPVFQQLCYDDNSGSEGVSKEIDRVFENSDMVQYTKQFLSLISFVIETNSETLKENKQTPKDASFYICDKVDPSEWLNFTKSLKYLARIHLVYFISDYITPEELELFAENLENCELKFLAIRFNQKKYNKIKPYLQVLSNYDLAKTKICVDLIKCTINETDLSSDMFNVGKENSISSFRLLQGEISHLVLDKLFSQLTSLNSIYFAPQQTNDYSKLLPLLKHTKLQGLHLFGIPDCLFQDLISTLSSLTCLEEVSIKETPKAYSILSHLLSLSKLTYVNICSDSFPEKDYSKDLILLLDSHKNTLKTLKLCHLHINESDSIYNFFNSLQSCTVLVLLHLEDWEITTEIDYLSDLKMPQSLISLEIVNVSLRDQGLKAFIRMILFHKSLRYVNISKCGLTSESCLHLCNLIFTLIHLRKLDFSRNELSNPKSEEFEKLAKAIHLWSSMVVRSPSVVTKSRML